MASPIDIQPGAVPPNNTNGWMSVPQGNSAIPPGLEYLSAVDQLLVHQVVEMLQAFTGWDTNNKYVIKNSVGQQVFYAAEETDTCMRICCKDAREFTIHILDNNGHEVMRAHRPFKCCAGCCWCANANSCGHEVTVEAPPGNIIGIVRQVTSSCSFHYEIQNSEGVAQLKIMSPCLCCTFSCGSDVDFPITTMKEEPVGKISKQWGGFAKEMFTTADNFGIQFPLDMDVKTKATLIGANFLIDFMVYERQRKRRNDF